MVGKTLAGQFKLLAVCGHGATGTVYRAMQAGMEREVAVKLLRADLLKDADVKRRFLREARAGARLSHPHIATVHSVGQTDEGLPFLVLEFVEGVALAAMLTGGKPMSLRRIVHIGAQIAEAIGEAHTEGIVHRDLKPENILLTERHGEPDFVKIVDFGIAKILAGGGASEEAISRMGTVFGTPHYIAPEQASGQDVTGAADLYSLGCILFQMATGRVPFDGQQGLQVLLRQVRDPVPDPRSLNARVDTGLAELILQLLAKEPDARPQPAEQVAARLRALKPDEPGERQDATGKSSAKRPDSRGPTSGLHAGGAVSHDPPADSWFQASDEEDEEEGEPLETEEETGDPAGKAGRQRATSGGLLRRAEVTGRPRSGRGDRAVQRTEGPLRPSKDRHRPRPRKDWDDEDQPAQEAAAAPSAWQLHGAKILAIGGAVVIGILAGLLYSQTRQVTPPTPAPLPLGPVVAPTAVPAKQTGPRPLVQGSASRGQPVAPGNKAVDMMPPAPAAPTNPLPAPPSKPAVPSAALPSIPSPVSPFAPPPATPAAPQPTPETPEKPAATPPIAEKPATEKPTPEKEAPEKPPADKPHPEKPTPDEADPPSSDPYKELH